MSDGVSAEDSEQLKKLDRHGVRKSILTVLLGAEGMSELQGTEWLREASKAERQSFLHRHGLTETQYREITVDGIGRPYWLVTLLENAPAQAQAKATQFARIRRLLE